jgi:dipeptidyl aminopeptidase/acylaminoacyl peptidase
MNTKTALEACSLIVECTPVDLTEELDSSVDNPAQRARALELLASVELYALRYRVRRGLVVRGYVAVPHEGDTLPCVINLRGGQGDFGKLSVRQLLWHVVAYAKEGYVVITTQYPGVEGGDGRDMFGGEDDIASIKKLRDILKKIPRADVSRIGVKGHSRGGLMAYMLMREVSWVRAAVVTGAPTDAARMGKEREGWRKLQIETFGASKEALVRRSPLLWAGELPKKAPILVMHGSADWRVRADHSIRMSQALLDAKVPHRFVLFEGADHGITEFRAEYHGMTRAWLARYLAHTPPLPNLRLHGE